MGSYYDYESGKYYENEEDYLDTLKKEDSYHFSIPFEYIKKNHGNANYDIAVAYMEVDVVWSDIEHGYKISYRCPDEHLIDPNEGNGDIDSFWECDVEMKVEDELSSLGIDAPAICI